MSASFSGICALEEKKKRGKGSVERVLLDTVSSIQPLFSSLAG